MLFLKVDEQTTDDGVIASAQVQVSKFIVESTQNLPLPMHICGLFRKWTLLQFIQPKDAPYAKPELFTCYLETLVLIPVLSTSQTLLLLALSD